MRNVYIIEGDTVFVEDQLGHGLRQYEIRWGTTKRPWDELEAVLLPETPHTLRYRGTSIGELVSMVIDGEEDGE